MSSAELWTMMSSYCPGAPAFGGYSQEAQSSTPPETLDISPMPNAGALNVKTVMTAAVMAGLTFAVLGLELITSEEAFAVMMLASMPQRGTVRNNAHTVATKWHKQLASLTVNDLDERGLTDTHRAWLRGRKPQPMAEEVDMNEENVHFGVAGNYFSIAKTMPLDGSAQKARPIFSGKKVSSFFQVPWGIFLPSIPDVLRLISLRFVELFKKNGRTRVCSS
jgi:hypothetical protein